MRGRKHALEVTKWVVMSTFFFYCARMNALSWKYEVSAGQPNAGMKEVEVATVYTAYVSYSNVEYEGHRCAIIILFF